MTMNDKGFMLVVSGPSGSGKTTVLSRLMAARGDLYYSVSSTTRKPRTDERGGVDYNFVSFRQFETDIQSELFLEWAEYSGNFYGTPKQPALDAIDSGKVAVLDIEVRGALQVKENQPNAALVYMWPGSFEELERRLRKRATETEEEVRKRLIIAMEEYKSFGEYKYCVLNNSVDDACDSLSAIITAERCRI